MKKTGIIMLLMMVVTTTIMGQRPSEYKLVPLNRTAYNDSTGAITIPSQPYPYLVVGGSVVKNGVLAGDWNAGSNEREREYAYIQGNTQRNHATQLLTTRWGSANQIGGGTPLFDPNFLYPDSTNMSLDFNRLTGKAIYLSDTSVVVYMNIIYFY